MARIAGYPKAVAADQISPPQKAMAERPTEVRRRRVSHSGWSLGGSSGSAMARSLSVAGHEARQGDVLITGNDLSPKSSAYKPLGNPGDRETEGRFLRMFDPERYSVLPAA